MNARRILKYFWYLDQTLWSLIMPEMRDMPEVRERQSQKQQERGSQRAQSMAMAATDNFTPRWYVFTYYFYTIVQYHLNIYDLIAWRILEYISTSIYSHRYWVNNAFFPSCIFHSIQCKLSTAFTPVKWYETSYRCCDLMIPHTRCAKFLNCDTICHSMRGPGSTPVSGFIMVWANLWALNTALRSYLSARYLILRLQQDVLVAHTRFLLLTSWEPGPTT
jgi:hypothetical protein